ncbi:hypothetical protein Q9L42_012565 [Methylomarinum sp. Ch1-1]|uniref:DUF86 domain-containing protein n=1 Tax=Methylomarinum roseum TaxID=3067653 RepID=A0AAU7NQH3_9GAMM|nr:hypothetical protein [Methylomarinum sp. Ch1-1]MDP4520857.1 hypothetical protein [Methylomarinum sp. Ch1-1]
METITEVLKLCDRHADRLQWAMAELQSHLPFSAEKLSCLTNVEIAILDQFSTRFGKLHDLMGAKLFPVILELTKEPGDLRAFIDKLYRLEKIGAIPSADDWLLMREIRNAFSHDYPDDPDLQAEILNKAFELAAQLLEVLEKVSVFIAPYIHKP